MSSRAPPSWVWEWVEREDGNLPPAPLAAAAAEEDDEDDEEVRSHYSSSHYTLD
jgi:hypothetical protein